MKKAISLFRLCLISAGVMTFMAISGCNGSDSDRNAANDSLAVTQPATSESAPATNQSSSALTDPQIASIAVTANQIDIDYAKVAQSKASNAEVKQFASTMIKDHQNVIDQATALAGRLNVTPEDNPTTQSLLDGKKKVMDNFNSLTGAAFDKAYIDNEVSYHKAAIDMVENTLVPGASNAELKQLLQSALPLFKSHLEHAESIQAKLK